MSDKHAISQDELKREFTNEDEYFRKLDEARIAAGKRRTLTRKMVCRREDRPVDGCELEPVQLLGMEVDRCATCGGVWFDAHEVEELRRSEKKQPGLLQRFAEMLVPRDHPKD
ncbi:MAG: zf-TFIIB domain-containing protein [Candidatus Eremiobacteraeota bacterium]|nr:zf-TFIIB domain-containing protein [Candidatus Eremiobacteraeota bacterium]MCW5866986.1 zf-TFIIB domain-containing protein [Candidatus Eremiobacteraeota bacterium]